jgi:hypothetical protein
MPPSRSSLADRFHIRYYLTNICSRSFDAAAGSIEDYFRQINAVASDAERERFGEHYGIRVVPG